MLTGFRRLALAAVATFAFLFAAAPAFAQDNNNNKASHEDNGIGVGVNFGFTTNSIHGADVTSAFKSKTGSLFGLWVGGNKNGLIGFTGEFNYVRAGFKDDFGDDVQQNIFEIPALFHVNVGSHQRNGVGGFILFGPSFDFLLNSKNNGIDNKSGFNGANIGIMAGAGIEAYRVGFQVRGNWGLRNIDKTGATSDVKTRSVQIIGTFRFN